MSTDSHINVNPLAAKKIVAAIAAQYGYFRARMYAARWVMGFRPDSRVIQAIAYNAIRKDHK